LRLVIRLVSWNVGQGDPWPDLDGLDADVALLQELGLALPPSTVELLPDVSGTWATAGWQKRRWRTAVARLSDKVTIDLRPTFTIDDASSDAHWSVSRDGTVTAADIARDGTTLFTAVSVYAVWERSANGALYADASAHRLLSDLSALLGSPRHRLIVAGDWNILYGYGDHGDTYYRVCRTGEPNVPDRSARSSCVLDVGLLAARVGVRRDLGRLVARLANCPPQQAKRLRPAARHTSFDVVRKRHPAGGLGRVRPALSSSFPGTPPRACSVRTACSSTRRLEASDCRRSRAPRLRLVRCDPRMPRP
jgi:hypothetical protein